jgi:hypothetical protein
VTKARDLASNSTGSKPTLIDAKGDLLVGTAADTAGRLAVGTNGHTLVADSGAGGGSVGLKWAAPSGGDYVKISRVAFSGVASQAFDGTITSTYNSYLIIIEDLGCSTTSANLNFNLRIGSSTYNAGGYQGPSIHWTNTGTQSTISNNGNTTFDCAPDIGGTTYSGSGYIFLQNKSGRPNWQGCYVENTHKQGFAIFGGAQTTSDAYDGFIISGSAGNITGAITIYGMAK